ncbi:predicted protein [Fibroporia radiculosa]|nr:predicted protein [Fibroporia radiculosa]
MNREKD